MLYSGPLEPNVIMLYHKRRKPVKYVFMLTVAAVLACSLKKSLFKFKVVMGNTHAQKSGYRVMFCLKMCLEFSLQMTGYSMEDSTA